METVITVEREIKMFDAMKITKKCKAFLKKHGVPFCDDYRIYRELGMIHCKVEDWRGPIELNGFPTFSMDDAIFIVIDSFLSKFYFQKELENRDDLQKIYPPGYGEYDPRKYAFEKVIEVFKDYSDAFYRKAIKKYTKCLNTNSHSKSRWVYDVKNESFVTLECVDCEKANLKEAEEDWRLSQGDFDDIKIMHLKNATLNQIEITTINIAAFVGKRLLILKSVKNTMHLAM